MKLMLKLIAGISLGIVLGLYAPDSIIPIMLTIKSLGGELIAYSVPLIILFYITSGIASLPKNSGAILKSTLLLSYLSTLLAGSLAYFAASIIIPSFTTQGELISGASSVMESLIQLRIPPLMSVTTALVCALIFGIGASVTQSMHMKSVVDEGRNIVDLFLAKMIIPFLPIYIASMFTELAAQGAVFATLKTFGMVLALAVTVQWVWIFIQFSIAGTLTGRSPLQLIKQFLPAYFTALGTMSSAATIPVTLAKTKQTGVDSNIANFTIPLCSTIHISGSMITLVTCSIAVMQLSKNITIPSFTEILPFISMLGIMMVAAPGVPGGGVMAATGLMASMLCFSETEIALMITLYLAQDSFGTAANVTGDGAISLLVNKFFSDTTYEEVTDQPISANLLEDKRRI